MTDPLDNRKIGALQKWKNKLESIRLSANKAINQDFEIVPKSLKEEIYALDTWVSQETMIDPDLGTLRLSEEAHLASLLPKINTLMRGIDGKLASLDHFTNGNTRNPSPVHLSSPLQVTPHMQMPTLGPWEQNAIIVAGGVQPLTNIELTYDPNLELSLPPVALNWIWDNAVAITNEPPPPFRWNGPQFVVHRLGAGLNEIKMVIGDTYYTSFMAVQENLDSERANGKTLRQEFLTSSVDPRKLPPYMLQSLGTSVLAVLSDGTTPFCRRAKLASNSGKWARPCEGLSSNDLNQEGTHFSPGKAILRTLAEELRIRPDDAVEVEVLALAFDNRNSQLGMLTIAWLPNLSSHDLLERQQQPHDGKAEDGRWEHTELRFVSMQDIFKFITGKQPSEFAALTPVHARLAATRHAVREHGERKGKLLVARSVREALGGTL